MANRFLVLDTETTGLDPKHGHKIIEIGCVELMERTLTGNNYQQFLNPERDIEDAALAVHGISQEDVQDKPTFSQIADDFIDYIRGATLIIHNAAFDVGFLNHELALLEKPLGVISDFCEVIDTLAMARTMHPGQRNSLDALCQRYFVSNEHRDLHGALLDSEILAEVYLMMTGGQLNLLGESDAEDADSDVLFTPDKLDTDRAPIKIIHAKSLELEEHKKWLSMLSESKGEAVDW